MLLTNSKEYVLLITVLNDNKWWTGEKVTLIFFFLREETFS